MKAFASARELKAAGARLEAAGDLEAAAAQYRKIVDKDPLDDEAVGRLLIVYRKLRNYREERSVIDAVLAAHEDQEKARREKWVREHSKAAAAGTAIFQRLGGSRVTGLGADPQVAALMKRRETVDRKLSGKKPGQRRKQPPVKAGRGQGADRDRARRGQQKAAAARKREA